jgi:hypothetical protein
MYADFEESEDVVNFLADAEMRDSLAINYLDKNPKQKAVLELIFPMNNQFEKDSSEAKLKALSDICHDVMMEKGAKGGSKNHYEYAFKALNTQLVSRVTTTMLGYENRLA